MIFIGGKPLNLLIIVVLLSLLLNSILTVGENASPRKQPLCFSYNSPYSH